MLVVGGLATTLIFESSLVDGNRRASNEYESNVENIMQRDLGEQEICVGKYGLKGIFIAASLVVGAALICNRYYKTGKKPLG